MKVFVERESMLAFFFILLEWMKIEKSRLYLYKILYCKVRIYNLKYFS